MSYVLLAVPRDWQLLVRRETLLDDLTDYVADDVDFRGQARFNEAFHVEGASAGLLRAPLMELLLRQTVPRLEIAAGYLLLANANDVWTAAELEAHLGLARRIAAMLREAQAEAPGVS